MELLEDGKIKRCRIVGSDRNIPFVAVENAIRIHHRYYLEFGELAERHGYGLRAHQEID